MVRTNGRDVERAGPFTDRGNFNVGTDAYRAPIKLPANLDRQITFGGVASNLNAFLRIDMLLKVEGINDWQSFSTKWSSWD